IQISKISKKLRSQHDRAQYHGAIGLNGDRFEVWTLMKLKFE
ncbi:hypothetical protein LINPERHAP1_LOCUS8167, partial [Linum perenne]